MLLKFKNVKIGKNNFISPTAIIHDNVTIGDNNNIHDNVIIYPNTTIGNSNNIFPRNIIGEFPISSSDKFKSYDFSLTKGVTIGNNNLFHINNIIFSGVDDKTFIGDNNKFLAENHLAHDVKVMDNVTFYPRCIQGGYSIYLNNSNIGMGAIIRQKTVVGQYSMIGANSTVTKHVFPYYINLNNKIHRLNESKIPNYVKEYDKILREINTSFMLKNYNTTNYNISNDMEFILCEFIRHIIFMK
jgi:acyl-[acyl carrier protein]--UDP-N-acetylglucosamine O-acyltransferase